jgi:7,8-dihydropterin-6-yl-methyl-4-(beta-D-ribofuranosyl)aminobenzene 5'-phosphate synthase
MNETVIETRITILVDNEVLPGLDLLPEHGLSVLIERGGLRILFDTGQGPALPHNAAAMGVALDRMDLAVLSHGHYDHTGGLPWVAARNPGLRVVAHPKALLPHFAVKANDPIPYYIGMPFSRETLDALGVRPIFVEDFCEIAPGVWFSGRIPRDENYVNDVRLAVIEDGRPIPDPMEDDASLLLDTPSGPVIVFGCAHAGVEHILRLLTVKRGVDRIHAALGGTHLGMLPEEETLRAVELFGKYDVRIVGTCHCTGAGPNRELGRRMGARFVPTAAGAVFRF